MCSQNGVTQYAPCAPSKALRREATSSMSAATTCAPRRARSRAFSESGLRVSARTERSPPESARIERARPPPCAPVAPVTAITFLAMRPPGCDPGSDSREAARGRRDGRPGSAGRATSTMLGANGSGGPMSDPDVEAVRLAVTRVAHHIDRRKWGDLEALYAADVETDYTSLFGGAPTKQPAKDLVAGWRAVLDGVVTQHLLGPV